MTFQEPETQIQELKRHAKAAAKDFPTASQEYVKSLFPILSWLPRYNLTWFIGDFIAGVTVALIIFPQEISYVTKLAKLPAEYGLYTGFIGCLLYSLFATSKDVTIGATAVLSLVVGQTIAQYVPKATIPEQVNFAVTLSFWTGIIQLVVGLLRLGVVVDFVPIPIIVGFTSGAGIQIVIQQLPGLLGIKNINTNNAPYQVLYDFVTNIQNVTQWDAIFGVTALFFILAIKYTFAHLAKKRPILRFVGFLRNAIVLIVYTGVAFALRDRKDIPLSVVKSIPYGFSGIHGPKLDINYASVIFPAVPTIFIVSLLEHIAIVKTYGRVNGYIVNPNQEIVAIGLTNTLGSFVGAIPATGSFSRSAIKSSSGVRTPLGTFYTGILVIIGLFTLTDVLYWIPNSVLSSIVIPAISELINFGILKSVLEVDILDFIGFFVALITVFVSNIENALYAGIGYSALVLLYRVARPRVKTLARTPSGNWVDHALEETKQNPEPLVPAPEGVLVFKIEESLTYPSSGFFAERLKETVLRNYRYTSGHKAAADRMWRDDTEERALKREKLGLSALPSLRAVVLDFSSVNFVDYTGLQALLDSKDDLIRFTGVDVPIYFVNVKHNQLNTLLRVPLAVSRVNAPPPDKPTYGSGGNVLAKFKKDPEADAAFHAERQQALVYFRDTIDDAVALADQETKHLLNGEDASK
ncbi:UNVERIFIED_CONTAM: hypothetical protein HDU68_009347 [Siphonaria sp. JEL0065]|nr:hypothetical protein HDU68_009347 [Siphonaria sp. JEL0065]